MTTTMGIEPTAPRLTVEYSTTELRGHTNMYISFLSINRI